MLIQKTHRWIRRPAWPAYRGQLQKMKDLTVLARTDNLLAYNNKTSRSDCRRAFRPASRAVGAPPPRDRGEGPCSLNLSMSDGIPQRCSAEIAGVYSIREHFDMRNLGIAALAPWLAALHQRRTSHQVTSRRSNIHPTTASSWGLSRNRFPRAPQHFQAHRIVSGRKTRL
jgi:hypothetical protein